MAALTLSNLIKNPFFVIAIIVFGLTFVIKYIFSGPTLSMIKLIMNLSVPVLLIIAFVTESKKP